MGSAEDVARDADAVQSLLDVAADFQASRHHESVTDPRGRASSSSSPTEARRSGPDELTQMGPFRMRGRV